MLFRDLRAAAREAAATRRIDQRPRLVTRRILEGRAAGPASERLRFLPGAGDRVHRGADRVGLARSSAEGSFDDHGAVRNLAVAVSVTELIERPFHALT